MNGEWITPRQAADMLGIPVQDLHEKFSRVRREDRSGLVKKSDVEQALDESRRRPGRMGPSPAPALSPGKSGH